MQYHSRWSPSPLTFLFLVSLTTASEAGQPSTSTSTAGSFARLSPGDRKIARALFLAQYTGETSVSTQALTLNEIAAMKLSGQGWGRILEEMKSRELVRQRDLGQAVRESEYRQGASSRPPVPSTVPGSGRTQVDANEEGDVGASTAVEQDRGESNRGSLSVLDGLGARGCVRIR